MTKRKSRRQSILGGFEFSKIDPYGGSERSETRLNVEAILPDPEQPRRLLSTELYQHLYSGRQRPAVVLQTWIEQAEAADAPPAQVQAVEQLRQLATTIEQRDLINPITVRLVVEDEATLPVGVQYIIVTGERRWWAHILLTAEERAILGERHPDRIRVSVVPNEHVRALQIIENVARSDLSLIEKAQGLLALRAELTGENGKPAQWGDVEALLGISRSYRSRLLKVLKLSPDAQQWVSRYNLAEKTIRPITEHLQPFPDLQLHVLEHIARWQAADEDVSHRRVAQFVHTLLHTQSEPPAVVDEWTRWVGRLQQRVQGTLKLFDTLDERQWSRMTQRLQAGDDDARQQLERLRDQLSKMLDAQADVAPGQHGEQP